MRRGRGKARNGNANAPPTYSANGPATTKLANSCPNLLVLKGMVQTSKPNKLPNEVLPVGSTKAAPKPKLKRAAQERFDRDFEAMMAAKAVEQLEKAKIEAAKAEMLRDMTQSVHVAPAQRPKLTANRPPDAASVVRVIVRTATPHIEDRVVQVSQSTIKRIDDAVLEGVKALDRNPAPDLDNGFIVGFDLGTSSLKLAVRQPYQADDPVVAMTAPTELQSNAHANLWQTVVWFDPVNERFSLYPVAGAVALAGFKTGVIGGQSTGRVSPDLEVTRAEATVAFFAMQLAYVFGRYHSTRPLGEVGGQQFLGINVGIPVAAHDDRRTFDTFARLTSAAFKLATEARDLRLADVRKVLSQATPDLPPGFKLVPELVAAIAGYAVEPTSSVGAHLLVDVGASTLDIVAFNLIERSRVSVFTAGVDLLGAAALDCARDSGLSDDQFKQACDSLFERVYGLARSGRRAPSLFNPTNRRRSVQLLTTGGGCGTKLHGKFIGEMAKPSVLGDLPILNPYPPARIAPGNHDHSRLLLAYGLTRDEFEILDLRLPSEIEDLRPTQANEPVYLSKSQIYD